MPVVVFSPRDLLRGVLLPPAWYKVHIESVGQKPSADGSSINFPVEATVIFNADNGMKSGNAPSGEPIQFEGVPVDWNFNSKAIGFAVGFLASFGVAVEAGKPIELAGAVGKDIDVFVDNENYQGRMVNKVNHKYRKSAA